MPAPPPDIIRRLVFCKYLLGKGVTSAGVGTDLAAAEACLALHDAAEILMRATTDHLQLKSCDKFMEFWSRMRVAGHSPPHHGPMDRLNSMRVAFKHRGILPNQTEVVDVLPAVRDFCASVALNYVGLDLASVSLAELVDDKAAHDEIRAAEAALATGTTKECLEHLRGAFDLIVRAAYEKWEYMLLPHIDPSISYLFLEGGYRPRAEADRGKLVSLLSEGFTTINSILLGLDPARLLRFNALTPEPTYGGNAKYRWPDSRPGKEVVPSIEACHSCMDFVLDTAMRMNRLSQVLPPGQRRYRRSARW